MADEVKTEVKSNQMKSVEQFKADEAKAEQVKNDQSKVNDQRKADTEFLSKHEDPKVREVGGRVQGYGSGHIAGASLDPKVLPGQPLAGVIPTEASNSDFSPAGPAMHSGDYFPAHRPGVGQIDLTEQVALRGDVPK